MAHIEWNIYSVFGTDTVEKPRSHITIVQLTAKFNNCALIAECSIKHNCFIFDS